MFPILADEDVDKPIIMKLRASGIDIKAVTEVMKGASDDEVLELARKEGRILVTFDKDFIKNDIKDNPGVIWISRMRGYDRVADAVKHVVKTIDKELIKGTAFKLSP